MLRTHALVVRLSETIARLGIATECAVVKVSSRKVLLSMCVKIMTFPLRVESILSFLFLPEVIYFCGL